MSCRSLHCSGKPASVRPAGGFTLIELLIVVAIIAILAAIAVPNFLEAQTRAKVSRAKSDMRTLATAIVTYQVDRNRQPPELGNVAGPGGSYTFEPANTSQGFPRLWEWKTAPTVLTTPISYLSSLPEDLFKVGASSTIPPTAGFAYSNGEALDRGYVYIDIAGWVQFENPLFEPAWCNAIFGRWGVVSLGPTRTYVPPAIGDYNDLGWVYDPTNGTVSRGMVVRTENRFI